ncbi:LysE family translocator [Peribacillus alkalitolerans]|uniref:LysE family translocator n=1 Tax=Peribacillus alkalitolerans TaxID=1550385 RepID=UPI0013D6AE2D|nr:LysE family translocator [Peribacillus alkalitolerans]
MMLSFFLKGLLIGISIAAPVGPIGVLCIRRTLTQGRLVGMASGLGAATADAMYGLVAGFGLTAVSDFLIGQQLWLQLIGGLFLCYLGVRTLLSKANYSPSESKGKSLLGAYSSVFLLTITNPMTILSFVAIFAGLGISNPEANIVSAMVLVVGVFIGSTLWWLTLSSGVHWFNKRIHSTNLTIINRLSGFIIVIFGVLALYGLR